MNSPLSLHLEPANEVGVPVLDEQHRGIIGVINSFEFSILHHNVEYLINNTFIMVECYTKIHFATEENIMRISGYQGLESHIKAHESLINESFSVANTSMRMYKPEIYLEFLKDRWMHHINDCDHMYIGPVRDYMAAKL